MFFQIILDIINFVKVKISNQKWNPKLNATLYRCIFYAHVMKLPKLVPLYYVFTPCINIMKKKSSINPRHSTYICIIWVLNACMYLNNTNLWKNIFHIITITKSLITKFMIDDDANNWGTIYIFKNDAFRLNGKNILEFMHIS